MSFEIPSSITAESHSFAQLTLFELLRRQGFHKEGRVLIFGSPVCGLPYLDEPVVLVMSTVQPERVARAYCIEVGKAQTTLPIEGYEAEAESSTVSKGAETESIERYIAGLFMQGADEVFEDGMMSDFSRGLISAVEEYGNLAIAVISELILKDEVSPEVAGEALRWLGEIEDPESYTSRLLLVEASLSSPHLKVRDGAVLGLSYLNDMHAVPALRRAIEKEKVEPLRTYMETLLSETEKRR
jgi:hypothetical protein